VTGRNLKEKNNMTSKDTKKLDKSQKSKFEYIVDDNSIEVMKEMKDYKFKTL